MPADELGAAARGGVSNSGSIGTVHGDIVGGNKIVHGLDEEALVNRLQALGVLVQPGRAGIERETIIKLAERLVAGRAIDFDQAVKELERAVNVAVDVVARGDRGASPDAFVNAVLAGVAENTRSGDFDEAAAAIDAGLAELDAAQRRARVALLREGIKMDSLRFDAVAVAARVTALVATLEPGEPAAWQPEFRRQRDQYFDDGYAKGLNFPLAVAIELARQMLATARTPWEQWNASVLLGQGLAELGDRDAEPARLLAAIDTYQAALGFIDRDASPLEWGATQLSLSSALQNLGWREAGTARFEAAATASRDAAELFSRDDAPDDWYSAQLGLGNALYYLGDRAVDGARLEEAVAAYCAALAVKSRDADPDNWSLTMDNLGTALQSLGERESGLARLEAAAAAHRDALALRPRHGNALNWAMTADHLGTTLTKLGERSANAKLLAAAEAQLRDVLDERTRDRVPLLWAATQNNLGDVLRISGTHEAGTARFEAALAAYRAALEEFDRDQEPLFWAAAAGGEGAVLAELAERSGDARLAARAVTQLDAVVAVLRDGGDFWKETQAIRDLVKAKAVAARLGSG